MIPWWHHAAYHVVDFFLTYPWAPAYAGGCILLGVFIADGICAWESSKLKRK